MIWARSLANAVLRVDKKQTSDHLVDASTNTIKYLNGPHVGWIGPKMSPWILWRNLGGVVNNLCMGGLRIQLPYRTRFAWRESNIGMLLVPVRRFEDTAHHVTSRMSQTIMPKKQRPWNSDIGPTLWASMPRMVVMYNPLGRRSIFSWICFWPYSYKVIQRNSKPWSSMVSRWYLLSRISLKLSNLLPECGE